MVFVGVVSHHHLNLPAGFSKMLRLMLNFDCNSQPHFTRHSRTRKKENHLHPSTTSELLFYGKSTTILQAPAQVARSLHRTGPRPAIVITPTLDLHGTLLSRWRFPVTPSQPEPGVPNSEVRERSATRQSRRCHLEARISSRWTTSVPSRGTPSGASIYAGGVFPPSSEAVSSTLPARSKRRTTAWSTSI